MNVLADENIARSIVQRLQADGHHVERMAEVARGGPDTEVLEIANQQNAIILTEDKDFGELVVRHQMQAVGIVLVRLDGFSPMERTEIVSRVVKEHANELPGSFTVIKPRAIRIRPNSHWDKSVH